MLHYYRSKEKLFEKVYQLSIIRLIPQIANLLNEDIELEHIRHNPDIPLFHISI